MILDDQLSSEEMRAVEMNSEYLGVSRFQLMESAGIAVSETIKDRFDKKSRVTIACGLGGNGGDGFVAARHLAGLGFKVKVFILGNSQNIRSNEALMNWKALKNMNSSVDILEIHDSTEISSFTSDVIVDALIGTGLKKTLKSPYKEMVKAMNAAQGFKIAIDIPSGIDANTGKLYGDAFNADMTLTFHKAKVGFTNSTHNIGRLEIKPIGIPPEAELYAGPGDIALAAKRRYPDSRKGDFGRVLVVGGSKIYSGAPALAALAAYSIGVDIVYVAAPETAASIISGFSPSMITIKMKGSVMTKTNLKEISKLLERVDVVAMGPGLGVHPKTIEAVNELIEILEMKGLPVIIDADALKAFAQIKRKINTEIVLTPHSGEYEILTGKIPDSELHKRGRMVEKEAKKIGATILLKGRIDVVSNGSTTRYNKTGNPGMTVGGTGDVLTGLVAGFSAMGASSFQASISGAFLNGLSGDMVYKEKGYHLSPLNIVEKIPFAMEESLQGRIRAQ
jgi:NAD(P)H-hydrate epimerase